MPKKRKSMSDIENKELINAKFTIMNNVATNPDIEMDKLQAVLDMQERIADKNAEAAFNCRSSLFYNLAC
jgi:hypothetical protein